MSHYTKRHCFTTVEYFFTQRLAELTYYGTLDSYRVRLNNPKSAITELCQVIEDWNNNKIKDFNTVDAVKNELIDLLNKEENLSFDYISKNSYLKLLSETKKDNYLKTLFASRRVIIDNKNYSKALGAWIEKLIDKINLSDKLDFADMAKLERILGYYVSELSSWGYSKTFLFHLTKSLFLAPSTHDFKSSFNELNKVVENTNQESYLVFLKAKFSNINIDLLEERIPELVGREKVLEFKKKAPEEFVKFYDQNSKKFPDVFAIRVTALDYYEAVKLARARVSEILDIVKLGYTERSLKIFFNALLIKEKDPTQIERQRIFYLIDGRTEKSPEIYDDFLSKYSRIQQSKKVSSESKKKIKSAIRYFRLGTESIEIEQKFINYWIGIEYIFSSHDASSSTFVRFKDFFSKIHALSYFKRNLIEFHNDLKRKRIPQNLDTYSENEKLDYLIEPETYKQIISKFQDSCPLEAYRANKLLGVLTQDKEFKLYIKYHVENIERHLIRIYRIRNEIVHEAAIKPNIENLTANLRYYLIFTITKLLDFFNNPPSEISLNNEVNLNDYFITKELEFSSYMNDKNNQVKLFQNDHYQNIIY